MKDNDKANCSILIDLVFGSSDLLLDLISKKLTTFQSEISRGPIIDRVQGLHGPENYPNTPQKIYDIDLRDKYVGPKGHNMLTKPTNFNSEALQTSSSPPACLVTKSFVFGMRVATDLHATPALHCLSNRRIFYAAGAVGVIHSLTTNNQVIFDKNDLEISCICLDPSGRYCATGQIGILLSLSSNKFRCQSKAIYLGSRVRFLD